MTIQTIELNLPQLLYQRIVGRAKKTQRDIQDMLVDTLNREFAVTSDVSTRQRLQQTHSITEAAMSPLASLVSEAQLLFDTVLEERHSTELPDMAWFLSSFEQVLHKIWQKAEDISNPHASIACELLNIAQIYQSNNRLLQIEQLKPLEEVLMLLHHHDLTKEDAARADSYLLAEGFQTIFQLDSDIADLYTKHGLEPA